MSNTAPTQGEKHAAHGHGNAGLAGLVVAAIGVVFGDIGTSPLYTVKQAFGPHYGLSPTHDTVIGLLSLVFWALMLVVTIKYVTIIMRADNEGEGGIMALMTLAQRTLKPGSRSTYLVGILGIFGASLFFGDGVITPAISVLSAVEGLEVVAPSLHHWIVPIVVVVLAGVFVAQRFGTEKVGKVFGPVMVAWFLVLAVLGAVNLLHAPEVLKAINPYWAIHFFIAHHFHGIFILGAVVLAVTGGEALYTDMGHFGARPIRRAWYFFVLPALMLNYLGQGALLLEDPAAIRNPFYFGVPDWARWPVIVLATGATVIASQAVITGAYSISRQAMQLGYIPRMAIKHTSKDTIGQIYIPAVNWTLMVLVLGLVLSFQTSTALATAYGISVSATMLIDTLLLALVARALWPKARNWVLPLCLLFLVADVGFLIANGAKILDGGWFPVVLGIVLFTLLRTWRRGRELLYQEIRKEGIQLDSFLPGLMLAPPVRVPGTAVFLIANGAKILDGGWFPVVLGIVLFTLLRTWRRGRELLYQEIRKEGIQLDSFLPGLMLAPPVRVPGTAVFMIAQPGMVPQALLHNLKHNKVLHERNVFLTVKTLNVPYAPAERRLEIDAIGDEFHRVVIRFGFMETPDVPLALMRSCDQGGIYFDPMETTYFASRENVVAGHGRGMPAWRDKLFAVMHRNAAPATGFFRIPGNRLVELGAQVEI